MSGPEPKPPGAPTPTPAPKVTTPYPFSTQSLLEMCWGLTMVVSHEGPQQNLGKAFNDQIAQMFADISKDDPVNADFIRNLTMTLSGTARSMAFVRAVHVQYLDFNADRLTRRRQNLEQMAEFASFSGSGLFAKVGSFAGVGSIADLLTKLSYPEGYIPVFVAAGVIGAFVLTLAVRLYVDSSDQSWVDNITLRQNKYWVEHFKADMAEELFNLYLAIKGLIDRFYPAAKDEIRNKDEFLRLTDEQVKEIISKQILPPDHLNWPPFTFPQLASESSAADSSKTTSTKGG